MTRLTALSRGQLKTLTKMVIEQINHDFIVIPRDKKIDDDKKHTTAEFLGLVLRFTAEHFEIDPIEIRGKNRHHPRPLARQVYFYLCHQYKPIDLSYVNIGAYVNKSHSMALTMPDKIKNIMSVDEKFKTQISEVERKFKLKITL